jgi:hypothetical protein
MHLPTNLKFFKTTDSVSTALLKQVVDLDKMNSDPKSSEEIFAYLTSEVVYAQFL